MLPLPSSDRYITNISSFIQQGAEYESGLKPKWSNMEIAPIGGRRKSEKQISILLLRERCHPEGSMGVSY